MLPHRLFSVRLLVQVNNGSHNGDDPSGFKTFGGGGQTPDYATGNPIIGSGSNRAMQLGLKLTF